MSYVTLAQAKAQLLVIHDADDEHIQLLIDAAESYCASYMNRPAITDYQECGWYVGGRRPSALEVSSSETPQTVPKSVVQAVLLTLTDFYENRSTGVVGTIFTTNPATTALLDQQRVGMGI